MTQSNDPQSSTHTSDWNLETVFVHSGRITQTDGIHRGIPTVPPIHASTTYIHESASALDQAFNSLTDTSNPSFVYSRMGNPSVAAFEDAMTRAEKGIGAVAFGSGMAAIHAALLAAGLTAGAKIVVSQDLYGPTITLIRKLFTTVGAQLILVDLCQPEAINLLRAEEPDIIYIETISNPLVKVIDIDTISTVAREIDAITIVDSTFTTPFLLRPLEHGIDLVVHSATKYISGHGDSTGGVVVSAKRVLLNQLHDYNVLLGAMLSPFETHLMVRGLRTLALRMERQCQNALQIAQFLQQHPAVERVYYPGLQDHPQHELASRLMDHEQFGGLLSFELREQSREAVFRFMDKLRLCVPATSLGDVFTLVSYPPVASHRGMTPAEFRQMGINDGCVRVSVGIENIHDIINDLKHALA